MHCASHLAEYGIVAAQGRKVSELIAVVRDGDDTRLPGLAREALGELVGQLEALEQRIARLDSRMVRHARENETARRLASIPGIGATGAEFRRLARPDPEAALEQRQGAPGPDLQAGQLMLRRLLVLGATSRLRHARRSPDAADWTTRLLARRPFS